jgi:sugar lactone lactonase YvrE
MNKQYFFIFVATIVLAVGCKPPFSAAPVDRARDTPFSVEARWQVGGAASSRGIIDDSLVATVFVEVLSSTGNSTGSGSLSKGAEYWRGTIQVSQTGLATFLASAKDSDGVELYYGQRQQTLSGENDQVTITVAHQIRGIVTTFAGTAGESGSTDGASSAALFYRPYGITTDGTNLYVADTFNNTIRKIVIATAEVTTLTGNAGQSGSADDTGSAALFSYPIGITTDGTNLYVADTFNNTIRKIVISTAEVTTLAGTAGQSGSTDDTGSAALFYHPYGIATDGTNLYVADTYNCTIRKIIIATAEITTLAGTTGSVGSTDGTGSDARFNNPTGSVTDGTNLYVVDSANCTIRKIIIATAEVTTLAGMAGQYGSTDGTGSAARFSSPSAITTDGTNLYVTDFSNCTIRKIIIATAEVTTLAGTVGSSGSTDGTGGDASFSAPSGITINGTNLYVADTFNNLIRKIE